MVEERGTWRRCLNLNEGIGISMVYGGGEGAWLRRGELGE